MRKVLSIFAMVAFMAVTAAPAIAITQSEAITVMENDKDKKEAKKEKGECTKEKKSSCAKSCTGEKKAEKPCN
jgi:methylthioribose-1-phosphate isomerase